MPVRVLGRDSELQHVRDFVARVPEGAAGLLLSGEAGIGKSTLWAAGVAEAEERGLRVLRAQPAESETALSFAGIGDLLDPYLEEALAPLPGPQRRALGRALVVEGDEGPASDPHAIGVALLGALRALAAPGPLLVAVDDVQWLDPASEETLAYAVRRLRAERIGVLLARRVPHESRLVLALQRTLPPERVVAVPVGPLDAGGLHRIVDTHLGVSLPRPLLAEVHAASGGNPLYALEIVRTLRDRGLSVEAGQPLPVPDSLRELVQDRLGLLSPESRESLLVASALSNPTVAIVEAASGVEREAGLGPALAAGVVVVDGERIRFTHPLFAAGAYETADPLRRARVHGTLAELVDDPEARARHLAASATAPDEEIASTLEEAARRARARGAPREAALLLDRARELTPPSRFEDASRRAIDAAYFHFESGDSPRAEVQLEAAIAELGPGDARARALVRLARVRSYEDQRAAVELFLRAVDEAKGDRDTLAVAHEGVAACLFRLRERLAEAVDHAELAVELAFALGDPSLAAEALGSQLVLEALLGREEAELTAARALELQEIASDRRVLGQPRWVTSVYRWWIGDLDGAREANLEMLQRAHERGDESSLPYVLIVLGSIECALGQLDQALERALEGKELSRQTGQQTLLAYHLSLEALVQAQRGEEDAARRAASQALELAPRTAGRPAEIVAASALGHLELSLGNAAEAAAALEGIVAFARAQDFGEPGAMRFVSDRVEALVESGQEGAAVELLDWFEAHARRLERRSALASAARCRGRLSAAAGRLDEAAAAFEEALAVAGEDEPPLERARTLLALGALQRRQKRRREARATLEQALALFERIGAALWAERARSELRRISGRAPAAGLLTPAEQRVAALVAEGKTNREVAAALFLSERTVEGHLSRIFGKVRVRSRTELARALAAGTREEQASNTGDSPVSAGPAAS